MTLARGRESQGLRGRVLGGWEQPWGPWLPPNIENKRIECVTQQVNTRNHCVRTSTGVCWKWRATAWDNPDKVCQGKEHLRNRVMGPFAS